MSLCRKRFRHEIGDIVVRGDVDEAESALGLFVVTVHKFHVYMLCPRLQDPRIRQLQRSLIVYVNWGLRKAFTCY
jgi:hypothetical protein